MFSGNEKEPRARRRIIKAAMASILLLGVAVALRAETEQERPKKPAWEWTIDERLAARFDPEAIEARAEEQREAAMKARQTSDSHAPSLTSPTQKGSAGGRIVIEGRKTPELYLPWELFSALLFRGFPPEEGREHIREERAPIEERAAALGFGRDLWDRLEKVASPVLKLQREEDQRHRTTSTDSKSVEEKRQTHLCRARAQALEAAKEEFGEEAFLRLLYEAVAPNVQRVYVVGPLGLTTSDADQLRFVARGCQ